MWHGLCSTPSVQKSGKLCVHFVRYVVYLLPMENTHIKQVAEQIILFSSFMLTQETDKTHTHNPFVIRYALDYILKVIKQQDVDADVEELMKECFWYIVNNYKTH